MNGRPAAPGSPGGPGVEGPGETPVLVVATHSSHKLAELRRLLDLPELRLLSLADLGITARAPEDGTTFAANARRKARFYARLSGLPTLADDSGLEVDALGGAPGPRSHRFAAPDATDAENNAHLLRLLAGVPPSARTARYVCVLAVADPRQRGRRGAIPIVAEARGTVRGRIAEAPRGSGGFGYDPLFEPAGEPPGGRTFGLYRDDEKGAVSHRGRAARRLARKLRALGYAQPAGRPPAG